MKIKQLNIEGFRSLKMVSWKPVSVLHTLYTGDRDFKRDINAAMKAAFGDEFDELVFPPASDQKIQLRIRLKSLRREQSAADMSDGTLRFLFLRWLDPRLAKPVGIKTVCFDGWQELVKDSPKKAAMHLEGPEKNEPPALS